MPENIPPIPPLELLQLLEQGQIQELKEPDSRAIEFMNEIEYGSPAGRNIGQYIQILYHNGAESFIERVRNKPNPTIVDAGCGAGNALAELRRLLPDSRLVGLDIRYVPNNTIIYRDGVRKTVHQNFEDHNIEFHQESLLNAPKIIPEGYDIFLAVGSFYDQPGIPYEQIFNILYGGLKKEGIIQLLLNPPDKETHTQMTTGIHKTQLRIRLHQLISK